MPSAKIVAYNGDYMDIIKLACSKPYGNNVTEKGVQAIIDSGHLSILEHCNVVFDVSCSVRVLGQLTRHRHESFTVKSARGTVFDSMIIPDKLIEFWVNKGYNVEWKRKEVLAPYIEAIKGGVPYEDAAYLLPQGVETNLVLSGNLRAWYEWLPKRLCKRAMPETRALAELIREELAKYMPEIFDRNFMNCAYCKEKSCNFK